MATTNRSDLVHRSRMGPFSLATALAGTVVGGAVLAASLAGANWYLRHNDSDIEMRKAWDKAWNELGHRGVLIVAGALLVSYLLGTFVAGRVAWRRGWLTGLQSDIDLRDREAASNEREEPATVATAGAKARSNGNGHKPEDGADIDGMTKDELYEMAQKLDISGRSSMTKEDLARSVQRKRRSLSRPRSR